MNTVGNILFLLVGVAAYIGSFLFYQNTSQFIEKSRVAPGIVTDFREFEGEDQMLYQAQFTFVSHTNEEVTFGSRSRSSHPSYEIGDAMVVYYNPDNPYDAREADFLSLWLATIFFAAFGTVFFIIGLTLIVVNRGKGGAK